MVSADAAKAKQTEKNLCLTSSGCAVSDEDLFFCNSFHSARMRLRAGLRLVLAAGPCGSCIFSDFSGFRSRSTSLSPPL